MNDRSPSDAGQPPQGGRWRERLLGALKVRGVSSIREGLADALSVTTPMAEFSPQEQAMLQNVLKLRNLRVDDVMVP